VGLVLVDPSSEDRLFTLVDGQSKLIASLTPEQLRSTLPTHPVALPGREPQTGAPFDQLPPQLYKLRIRLDERLIASSPETATPEMIAGFRENERAMLSRLLASRSATRHPLGDRPTVVLSRGDERSDGREAAVIQAIRDVLQAIGDKEQLPRRPGLLGPEPR